MSYSTIISLFSKKYPNFNFAGAKYKDEFTPIKFSCRKHPNKLSCLPVGLSKKHFECPVCKNERKPESLQIAYTLNVYLNRAKKIHGERFKYHRITYHVNCDFPIPIYDTKCGNWQITTWYKHLKYGCLCNQSETFRNRNAKQHLKLTKEFNKAKKRHKNFKVVGEYTGFLDKTDMRCTTCKTKKIVGQQYFINKDHIQCESCPKPASNHRGRRFGKMEDEFLDAVERHIRLRLIREFICQDLPYRLDGFNEHFKIAFEFHGDAFHGNPKVHSSRSKPNYFSDKTAYRLHRDTVAKETDLGKAGYTVIAVWEKDWKTDSCKVLDRVLIKVNKVRYA